MEREYTIESDATEPWATGEGVSAAGVVSHVACRLAASWSSRASTCSRSASIVASSSDCKPFSMRCWGGVHGDSCGAESNRPA